jgi:hypothetical protein
LNPAGIRSTDLHMNLDRVLHSTKAFAELDDTDIARFLQERPFRSENLNLEFKGAFPVTKDHKHDIKKICKYIVGFSNEEGGLVIYGVADSINKEASGFLEYLVGLEKHPTLEDLSQWVTERIHPLVQSPAIRFFHVDNRKVAILKIPRGVNRPYCYCDPGTGALTFFKKTAGGIVELTPTQVGDMYRAVIIEQSERILRASGLRPPSQQVPNRRLVKHKNFVIPRLEDIVEFGHVGIYCLPHDNVNIPVKELEDFIANHRFHFSEVMRYYLQTDALQDGISVGYFPRAIRQAVKSTARITVYRDGLAAYDAQVDMHMDKDNVLNPYWLCYEIQRQLQLVKALLEPHGAERVTAIVEFKHIENFVMAFSHGPLGGRGSSPYSGSHEPIVREILLAEIPHFDGADRNVVCAAARDIIDEACRVFGLSKTVSGVWDQRGSLAYVKALENQR